MASEGKVAEGEDSRKTEDEEAGVEDDAFEQLLSHVGTEGLWQWMLLVILSTGGIFCAFNNYAAVFLAAAPDFVCVPPGINESIYNESSNPFDEFKNSSEFPISSCQYNVTNASNNSDVIYDVINSPLSDVKNESQESAEVYNGLSTGSCKRFVYDHSTYESTIVTEWNLVCDRRWLMTLTQTTYMLGMLVGGFTFSELSDIFGRRVIVLTTSVAMIASALGAAFAQDYTTFIVLRFIVAATGTGMFLANFVSLMEIAGQKSRGTIGLFFQMLFSLGTCLLALIAHFVTAWRTLCLAMSVPSLIMLIYFWFLPESPRWLFHNGREAEALKVLERGAKINKRKLPEEKDLRVLVANITQEVPEKKSAYESLLIFVENEVTLVRTPILRRRCLIIFFSWFVVAMMYYGLVFNGGNLELSVNLTLFLAGALEALAIPTIAFAFNKFGRRLPLLFVFILGGTACMLILAVPKDLGWLNLTLVCVGRFCASAAFDIVYVYSAELVPTGVRNSAVGTANLCSRVGSAIAPFIVDGLGTVHYTLPSTVFGVLSIIAGLLVFFLPDTGKMNLPSTVEEVEALER